MTAQHGGVPARRIRGLLWGLVPLFSAGLLGWLPHAVWATVPRAGVRRRAADVAVAAGYAAWSLTALALAGRAGAEQFGAGLTLVLVLFCTAHTAVRGMRRSPRLHGVDCDSAEPARAGQRDRARRLLESEPQVARELGIGRPDLRRSYDDGGLLDINGVPPRVLVRELGWTEAEAVDVTPVRDRVGGFSGPAELLSLTAVAPPRVDAATPRLVFSAS